MPDHCNSLPANTKQIPHDVLARGERILRLATAGCSFDDLSKAASHELSELLSVKNIELIIYPVKITPPTNAAYLSPLKRACIIEANFNTAASEKISAFLNLLDAAAQFADLPVLSIPLPLIPDSIELYRYLAPAVMHDLRNVLAGIIGALELHRTQIDAPDPAYLDATLQRALEGVAITDGWREVFGEYPKEHQITDCAEVCMQVVTILGAALRNIKGFENLKFNLQPVALKAQANPAEIRRALVSILLNAALVAPGGNIVVTMEQRNQRAIISVTDDGPGMSEVTRRKAKEPFYTEWGGEHWGVGLTIAEGVAKRFHGSLALRITNTAGALVALSLPVCDA